LTRPPPLQLHHDNTRPGLRPELQSQRRVQPESKSQAGYYAQVAAFATQVYQANWKNLVVAVAIVNALRFFVSAITAFQDVDVDAKTHRIPKLGRITLALGALYFVTAIIQVYGALSACLQRLTLIRVYVYLAFLSALLITTTGFISAIEYFMLAEDLISECVSLAVSGSWISKTIFRGKLSHGKVPSTRVAQEQCIAAWSHGSISHVLAVFAFYLIPAVVFFFLAYTYYRQTIDLTHSACLVSTRRDIFRLEAYPDVGYNSLHTGSDTSNIDLGHTDVRARTPRRGQPGRGPAGLSSRTSSPYGVSPGPPSYDPVPGGMYGYALNAAWFAKVDQRREIVERTLE